MRGVGWLAALSMLGLATGVWAQPVNIQVVGLFANAAVLLVDGQRKLVKSGQTGPDGVVVVSANSQGAVLRVNGENRAYSLSREYGTGGFSAPRTQKHSIARGQAGHYWTSGSINGQHVQFLVDTGASAVAMNEDQARRLGLDYRVEGTATMVSTASGTAKAWHLKLRDVAVGGISVLGVDAVVIEGNSPTEVLLGMSYLNHVGWREEQGMLVLESKL